MCDMRRRTRLVYHQRLDGQRMWNFSDHWLFLINPVGRQLCFVGRYETLQIRCFPVWKQITTLHFDNSYTSVCVIRGDWPTPSAGEYGGSESGGLSGKLCLETLKIKTKNHDEFLPHWVAQQLLFTK